MKTYLTLIVVAICAMDNAFAQNIPPTLDSATPDISGGYIPNTQYNMYVSFTSTTISECGFKLKIANQANPGVIGTTQPVANVDTVTENGMFYVTKDTNSFTTGNFKWTSPSSPNETITFELLGHTIVIGGTQTVDYACEYEVTNSSFGLTGACNDTSGTTTGIMDTEKSEVINLEVHPNPTEENITISYSINSHKNTRIDILDLSGKSVLHVFDGKQVSQNYKHEVNVSDLAGGTYLVRVTVDENPYYQKISVH